MTTTQRNRFWRRVLRVMAAFALLTELVFSIMIPKIKGDPVFLDKNDGYIIGFSVALLISIEVVKMAIDKYVNKHTNK